MSKSVLANKIGRTLFDIAKENDSLDSVLNDLQESSKAILINKDFITLMNNPNLLKEKKIEIIDSAFSGVDKNVINTIKILSENLQISLIESVEDQFVELYNKEVKNINVRVESAQELTVEQIANLKEKIKEQLKLNNVVVSNVVDPSLLGGLKIVYNNKVIDSTIKAKLNFMKKQIATI